VKNNGMNFDDATFLATEWDDTATTFEAEEFQWTAQITQVSATKQEDQQQHIYLRRLEIAARHDAKKKKRTIKTFAAALQHTRSDAERRPTESSCVGEDITRFEEDDAPLLLHQERSHAIEIDSELAPSSQTYCDDHCPSCCAIS